jgi:hypothetical protein
MSCITIIAQKFIASNPKLIRENKPVAPPLLSLTGEPESFTHHVETQLMEYEIPYPETSRTQNALANYCMVSL